MSFLGLYLFVTVFVLFFAMMFMDIEDVDGDKWAVAGAIILWPLTAPMVALYAVVRAVVAAIRLLWKAGR